MKNKVALSNLFLVPIVLFNTFCAATENGRSIPDTQYLTHKVAFAVSTSSVKTRNQFLIEESPYKYSSYYQDYESGMYYLKARYYSSELMRFISLDTYDLSNRYAYCDGNPISKIDPSGHIPTGVPEYAGYINYAIAGLTVLLGAYNLVLLQTYAAPLRMKMFAALGLLGDTLGIGAQVSSDMIDDTKKNENYTLSDCLFFSSLIASVYFCIEEYSAELAFHNRIIFGLVQKENKWTYAQTKEFYNYDKYLEYYHNMFVEENPNLIYKNLMEESVHESEKISSPLLSNYAFESSKNMKVSTTLSPTGCELTNWKLDESF